MSDHELLDDTRTLPSGVVVRRIRAGRDLPLHSITAGQVGGWVESLDNIADQGWVADEAVVYGHARVYGAAMVRRNAAVFGHAKVCGAAMVAGTAEVYDDAWVYGHGQVTAAAKVFGLSEVYDGAVVCGEAQVSGRARVCGSAVVDGLAVVFGNARICEHAQVAGNMSRNARATGHARVPAGAFVGPNAYLRDPQDILVLDPVGSHDVTVTLSRNESGHTLRVGCWAGVVEDLAAEVERRSRRWSAPEHTMQAWRRDYAAIEELLRSRVDRWATEASA